MSDVVPSATDAIPAGAYPARVGGIKEKFTHAGSQLMGMYFDWEFVIDGGEFDGVILIGHAGGLRLASWTEAAQGAAIPRPGRINMAELRGRPVMLDVIQTPRKDGDGVMNAVAAVKGRMAG